jgi:outer membrane protein OmpA-like peptidoglycan-associated protein
MKLQAFTHRPGKLLVSATVLGMLVGCATFSGTTTRTTERDKTKKGAAIGAATGAVLGALVGEGEADEILAGAIIGAGIGAGVGAYMDKQEEKLARIPGTQVERVGKDTLLIHFESDILFRVDSTLLNSSAQSSLNQVASVLDEFPKTAVVIQGHTDSTGSEVHNQNLSERRAGSVRNFLIGRGLDAERMVAVGYGENYPVASNESSQGRNQNRRVDILLKAKAT